jgi:type II secretory pathway component PulF
MQEDQPSDVMPAIKHFSFKVTTSTGGEQTGTIAATSIEEARAKLKALHAPNPSTKQFKQKQLKTKVKTTEVPYKITNIELEPIEEESNDQA